jgi:hypothetical protein
MANKPAEDAERPGRVKQIRMIAQVLREANPKALPLVFGAAIGTLVLVILLGLVIGQLWFMIPLAVLAAVAVGMLVFGQVAQRTQYKMLAGQPGAAASVLESMRGNWTVTPAVSGNRNLDLVHRVVGRPGVILVAEGSPARVGPLLGAEKKRIARVAQQVAIYDFQVGEEEGQVPIGKLQRQLMKLPRTMTKTDVAALNDRLRALPQTMRMPKGPIPKGTRMPKAPKPRSR